MKKNIDFDEYYDFKTISSGVFGVIQSAKHIKSLDKLYTVKSVEISPSNKESFINNEIKLLEKLRNLDLKPKALGKFIGFAKNKQKSKYNLIFDVFPKNFKEIIDNLKTKNSAEIFPFSQLKNCFDSVVKTLAFSQTLKICHLEVKPANIYFDASCSQIYLIDFAHSKEIIMKASADRRKEFTISGSSLYFPPEIDAFLNSSSNLLNINPFKADVFSFALVILEIATLQLPSKIYGPSQWKEGIDNTLKKIKDLYKEKSQNTEDNKKIDSFVKTLSNCLEFNPDNRPDFVELFLENIKESAEEKLRLHVLLDEEILNLENLKSFENFRGQDFSLYGITQNQKTEVKIFGTALNSIDKEFFSDEEDLKNALNQLKPIGDFSLETSSKRDPKDIEPAAYYFNQNVFSPDLFDNRRVKKFSFLCIPSKKLVNHAAEKYWNKMFFDVKQTERMISITPTADSNEVENSSGRTIMFKHYHEIEWAKGLIDFHIVPMISHIQKCFSKKIETLEDLEIMIWSTRWNIQSDESTMKAITNLLADIKGQSLKSIRIGLTSYLTNLFSLDSLLSLLKQRADENKGEKITTFSLLLNTNQIMDDTIFEAISSMMLNLNSLKCFKLCLTEMSRKNDFERNNFFPALEKILPTLNVFNLGFGSYGVESKLKLSYNIVENLFKIFHKSVSNEMKSFSIFLDSFEVVSEKAFDYLFDLLVSRKNFCNVDILCWCKYSQEKDISKIEEKIQNILKAHSQKNEEGILFFYKL